MSPPRTTPRKPRLGELLLEAGVLDETHLKAALHEQRKWGSKLGGLLIDMGFIKEAELIRVLAQQLSLPAVELDKAEVPAGITKYLRLDMAERHGVFPVKYDADSHTLHLATADPTNIEALQELEFASDARVTPVLATPSAIDRAIRRYYFGERADAPPSAPRLASNAAAAPLGTPTATPRDLGVDETTFELDQLMGEGEPAAPKSAMSPPPLRPPGPPQGSEVQLRREIAVLHEQVDSLENVVSSQVRAMRSLLEVLISSGLVSREEYLERVHRADER